MLEVFFSFLGRGVLGELELGVSGGFFSWALFFSRFIVGEGKERGKVGILSLRNLECGKST